MTTDANSRISAIDSIRAVVNEAQATAFNPHTVGTKIGGVINEALNDLGLGVDVLTNDERAEMITAMAEQLSPR